MSHKLNKAEIENLIPHRAPMLLVDEVTGWQPDAWLEATCTFPQGAPQFAGHFPGDPLLPGVLMVEAMAQSAAILTSLSRGVTSAEVYYLFMGITAARFKAPLRPGQTLAMRVNHLRNKLDVYEFEGTASVEGNMAARAAFSAKLIRK